jgi:hypothetical protein
MSITFSKGLKIIADRKENGTMTTSQHIGTHLSGILASQSQKEQTLQAKPSQLPSQSLPKETPLRESVEAQNQLTLLLQQAYACQKTYADKAEMMEYRDGMFQMILGDYPLEKVKWAFIEHIKTSADLPTPSDIVKLISERKWNVQTIGGVKDYARLKEKGIPLTPSQQRALDEANLI